MSSRNRRRKNRFSMSLLSVRSPDFRSIKNQLPFSVMGKRAAVKHSACMILHLLQAALPSNRLEYYSNMSLQALFKWVSTLCAKTRSAINWMRTKSVELVTHFPNLYKALKKLLYILVLKPLRSSILSYSSQVTPTLTQCCNYTWMRLVWLLLIWQGANAGLKTRRVN